MLLDPNTQKPVANNAKTNGEAALRWLPKMRDGAIIVVSVTYALGYAVWAIYAYKYGLGVRPAGQTQYFVAGGPALIIIGTLLSLFYAAPILLDRARQWLTRRFGMKTAGAIGILSTLMLLVGMVLQFDVEISTAVPGSLLVAVLLVITETIAMGLLGEKAPVRLLLLPLVPIGIGAVYFYATEAYPKIPQELGGGRPQCVMIGLQTHSVTPSWRGLVLESWVHARNNMIKVQPMSPVMLELIKQKDGQLKELLSGKAEAAKLTEAGPLLLWAESDSQLIVSIGGYDSDMDDRFIIGRTNEMIVRRVSEIGSESVGCEVGAQ